MDRALEHHRELLLLRHAKSAWDTEAEEDFARPLAPRGRRTAPRIGRWLAKRGLRPDSILTSPAVRAAQTARLVAAELGVADARILAERGLYEASAERIAALAAERGQGRRVLVVGHNPGLEDLVRRWGGEAVVRPGGKLFPTAAIALVRIDSNGTARVIEVVRPRDLEE
jgi:phosphohistidine phosphatase